MTATFEIVTERLILRHPVLDDAHIITQGKKDVWPELQAWMSWAFDGQETLESTKAFIDNLGPHSLIGFCRESGAFAVMTGLTPQEDKGVYETGYWVAKDFLGRGYATEATAAAVHFAFDVLQAEKITICHFEGNEKSRNVIKKLGFGNETIVPKSRKSILDGSLQDCHDFTMTDFATVPDITYEWRGQW